MFISDLYPEVEYLYNICSINNLESVCKNGLLSKNKMKEMNISKYTDLSNPKVQKRREPKKVFGSPLHDYANLYFNARNAMTFYLKKQIDISSVCIICFSKKLLNLKTAAVTDRNAACDDYTYYRPFDGFGEIDFKTVFDRSWDNKDFDIKQTVKSIMEAEVLILDKVDKSFIEKIKVPNKVAQDRVLSLNLGIDVEIDTDMFFD